MRRDPKMFNCKVAGVEVCVKFLQTFGGEIFS